jgi:hypothetical protein
MRPNRWVLLISLIAGIGGTWSYLTAIQDYRTTAEAYTSVDAVYVAGSFVWLDDADRAAEAEFIISNDSRADARVDFLILRLYLDGAFAGAQYRPWEALEIPRGAERRITVPFEFAGDEQRPDAAQSDITLRGEMRLVFASIEQPLTVSLRERIGEVERDAD